MPKLDGTHIAERLQDRLAKLKSGEEVAARDMKSLLSAKQTAVMDAAWVKQQALRKQKRARDKAKEVALGWKTKRDIHIEALTQALREAELNELAAWRKKLQDANIRQGRVYFDELSVQMAAGVDAAAAKTRANNALTRAGLKRLDGAAVGTQGLTPRDKKIRAIEDAIQQKNESEMDDYEREQLELLHDYEKAVIANRKKQSR